MIDVFAADEQTAIPVDTMRWVRLAENVLAAAAFQMLFGGAVMCLAGWVHGEWTHLAFNGRTGGALLYLLVFGLGTVVGMSLVTLAIAAPAAFAASRVASMQRGLRLASGAISLVFGVYLAHRIGVVDGLFVRQ